MSRATYKVRGKRPSTERLAFSGPADGMVDIVMARRGAVAPGSKVNIIIQVVKQGYVPVGVKVLYRISPTMVVAELPVERLASLKKDLCVSQVSAAREIHLIE